MINPITRFIKKYAQGAKKKKKKNFSLVLNITESNPVFSQAVNSTESGPFMF